MSAGTNIEWTDATWNPTTGCTRVSTGCDHCYAVPMTRRLEGAAKGAVGQGELRRRAAKYVGLTVQNDRGDWHFNGKVRCDEASLVIPLAWKKPRMVFVNSMSDLFHAAVPFEFIAKVFDVMCSWRWPTKETQRAGDQAALVDPGHIYQVLTKRPERIEEFLDWVFQCWPGDTAFNAALTVDGKIPKHIWLGASVEDQVTADHRIPFLLRCPAAVRFLSCEPLLGPIDLRQHFAGHCPEHDFPGGFCVQRGHAGVQHIHWVIVGGESGPRARPCNMQWIRSIIAQCGARDVPCFVKQVGSRPVDLNGEGELRPGIVDVEMNARRGPVDPKGGDVAEWPEDLRVREWPVGTDGARTV